VETQAQPTTKTKSPHRVVPGDTILARHHTNAVRRRWLVVEPSPTGAIMATNSAVNKGKPQLIAPDNIDKIEVPDAAIIASLVGALKGSVGGALDGLGDALEDLAQFGFGRFALHGRHYTIATSVEAAREYYADNVKFSTHRDPESGLYWCAEQPSSAEPSPPA